MLAHLAKQAGAEIYHFQQPNQYVPGSKPLTKQELAVAFRPGLAESEKLQKGFSLLRQFGGEIRKRNIDYFDLTQFFSNSHESLYSDDCCHLTQRGRELLAETVLRRILATTPTFPALCPWVTDSRWTLT